MATQTLSASNNLLRRALQGDGLISAALGLLGAIAAGPIASFMGLPNVLPIVVLGIALVIWGMGVYALSSREVIDRRVPTVVILANIAWVVGSAIILAADLFGLSGGGRWGVLLVADAVVLLTIAEFVGLRRVS
jgi:hypothetical protein